MMVNSFSQFESPVFLPIPLFLLALILPSAFYPSPSPRCLSNRTLTLQNSFIGRFAKQLLASSTPKVHLWATLLVSLMLYIISLNLLGMLPYTFTPTTQLSMNMGLAVPLSLATVLVGFRNQPTLSLAHLLPEGTPTLLVPVLIIIETISLLIRPFALGVRLTANLTGGHLLIQLIATATLAFMSIMPAIPTLTSILLLLLTLLEIAVAMIQAYVFVLLLSLYLQENS
uniref:ATP synthase subunit a n=1 Tax=Monopterus albus TaxID=43700 RepID=A0A0F6QI70_MONAL|nr:ATP synthase subunit 6 [Monopterus albus]